MQCFFTKSNTFIISVTFLDDTEKLFKIPLNQKASVVLLLVAKSIPVYFTEYFGLKYYDRFQKPHWINPEKSLYNQLKKSQIDKPANMNGKNIFRYSVMFEVRYYPRDPTSINDDDFRYQIFLQIRKDLSVNKLIIKDERVVAVLCALILQSDLGDYDRERFVSHYIRQSIPSHLLTAHIEEQIKSEHIKLRGVEPVSAEYQFLEKARWLENYGTITFLVKDTAYRNCFLGLNPQGFSVRYFKDVEYKYDIFWPRICSIKRKGRQFNIKEKCEVITSHTFEIGEKCLCKLLYRLSLDHYAFFKLKKDDKPLVKEPPKRTFGRHSSRELCYSSDTSDNYQQSDDTLSSYPDSVITTQSQKMIKCINKASLPLRNCVSDAEDSTFLKKSLHSPEETEDEVHLDNDENCYQEMVASPAKPTDAQFNIQIRQKRLTKKNQTISSNERKFHGHRELEQFINRKIIEPKPGENIFHIPFKSVRTRELRYQVTRSKSGAGTEGKVKLKCHVPLNDVLLQATERVEYLCFTDIKKRLPASTSADSIMSQRTATIQRLQPNVVPDYTGFYSTPIIDSHQNPSNLPINVLLQNRPQSLFTDGRFKPAFHNAAPRIPHFTVLNQCFSNNDIITAERSPNPK